MLSRSETRIIPYLIRRWEMEYRRQLREGRELLWVS